MRNIDQRASNYFPFLFRLMQIIEEEVEQEKVEENCGKWNKTDVDIKVNWNGE